MIIATPTTLKQLLSICAVAGSVSLSSPAARAHELHAFAGIVYGCPGGAPTTGFVKHNYPGNSLVPLNELVLPAPDCAGLTLVGLRIEARADGRSGPQLSVLVGGHLTSVPETIAASGSGPYYFPTTLSTPAGLIAPTGGTLNTAALKIVGNVWIDKVTLVWGPAIAAIGQQPLSEAVQAPLQEGAPIQQQPNQQ